MPLVGLPAPLIALSFRLGLAIAAKWGTQRQPLASEANGLHTA